MNTTPKLPAEASLGRSGFFAAAVAALLFSLPLSFPVRAVEQLDVRLKAFATVNDLPNDDLQSEVSGTPAYDGNLDLRIMLREQLANWELEAHHSTIGLAGDGFEFSESRRGAVDETPTDDERRALELTWTLDQGDRHRVYHRFDRLVLKYRAENWGLTLGRDALSWGSGKVFNPMDLFAPFAPTTVDRDYKAGEDLIMADSLLEHGGDVQLVAVFRRDGEGDRDLDEGSYGGKWRSFIGSHELELAAGRHYEDQVYALTYRMPLGGALLQTDWIATELDEEDEWKVSGVINLDYSFTLADRPSYIYAEYYRNGFGQNQSPVDLLQLPGYLQERLQRGEVFNLMKDYVAVGGRYEWHPLLTQDLTWLVNLHDNSGLLQTNIAYEPGDQQRLEAGITLTHGDRGDEYGRIDVGDGFTTGGGSRLFLRWLYYW